MSNTNPKRLKSCTIISMDWSDITYLKRGNTRQRQAYVALHSLNLFPLLAQYSPFLAGTVPLGIDIYGSDLDILCQAGDLTALEIHLRTLFGGHTGFNTRTKTIRELPTLITRFEHAGFPIEIFAQDRPVQQQHSYRHMLMEARLLDMGGDTLREAIRELKLGGMGTEPAFAHYLGLDGDGYQTLLELESWDEADLRRLVEQHVPNNGDEAPL